MADWKLEFICGQRSELGIFSGSAFSGAYARLSRDVCAPYTESAPHSIISTAARKTTAYKPTSLAAFRLGLAPGLALTLALGLSLGLQRLASELLRFSQACFSSPEHAYYSLVRFAHVYEQNITHTHTYVCLYFTSAGAFAANDIRPRGSRSALRRS